MTAYLMITSYLIGCVALVKSGFLYHPKEKSGRACRVGYRGGRYLMPDDDPGLTGCLAHGR